MVGNSGKIQDVVVPKLGPTMPRANVFGVDTVVVTVLSVGVGVRCRKFNVDHCVIQKQSLSLVNLLPLLM